MVYGQNVLAAMEGEKMSENERWAYACKALFDAEVSKAVELTRERRSLYCWERSRRRALLAQVLGCVRRANEHLAMRDWFREGL